MPSSLKPNFSTLRRFGGVVNGQRDSYYLVKEQEELGMVPLFWKDGAKDGQRAVLPMVRLGCARECVAMGERIALALGLVIVGGCIILASLGLAAFQLYFSTREPRVSTQMLTFIGVMAFMVAVAGIGMAAVGTIIGIRPPKDRTTKPE
jgi:hypothetical protein